MLLLSCLLWGQGALAQSTGIAVDRFVPAPGPGAFLGVESADVPGAGHLHVTTALWVLSRPLVLNSAVTGEEVAVPVQDRLTLDLGAELGIYRSPRARLALGFGLPLCLWQDGDGLARTGRDPGDRTTTDSPPPLHQTEVGDIRLRAKAALTPLTLPVQVATSLEVALPGGGQGSFVASAAPSVTPRLSATWRSPWVAAGVNGAVRFGSLQRLYQTELHIDVEWGTAVAGRIPLGRRADLRTPRPGGLGLVLIAEATGLCGTAPGGGMQSPLGAPGPLLCPVEARGAVRLLAGRVGIDLGAGGGLGHSALAPAYRVMLVVRTQVTGE